MRTLMFLWSPLNSSKSYEDEGRSRLGCLFGLHYIQEDSTRATMT